MRIKYFITKSAKIILTTMILLIASIVFCSGEPEVHAAEIDDTDIVLSGDEGITENTDQENIELPPSSAENIPAAPGSADEELSSDSKAVEENMNAPEAADESKSESGSESESESKLELDSESATNTETEEQLDIDSNEPADSEEPINSEEPLIEPDAELNASSAEEVLSDQVFLLSAFAAKKAERKDGVYIIDNVPYVYDNDGNLVKNAWYKTSAGQITYGDANGITILNDVMPLAEGNYVFGADGYLVKNAWIETADGKKAYGNPNTGEAYTKGAFSVKDGDRYVRYVFDQNGYLLKNDWVYEEGYGWAYGRPEDGAAYIRGAFTVKDNIRYAFDNYGFVAENRWIYEPGYGYAFGRPKAPGSERGGAVYREGAFTVSDGIRYVFDDYGYRSSGRWVYEEGYGWAYGNPYTDAAYLKGAFSLPDGIRYAFDNYGYLAENRWIYEPGYGYAFGRPRAPGSERGGAVYRGGAFTISDGIRYAFNDDGFRADGKWVYEPGYGWTYGEPGTGKTYRNKKANIDGRIYYFNIDGFWGDLQHLINREAYSFSIENNKIYLKDSAGRTVNTNFTYAGKRYWVNPVHYNIIPEKLIFIDPGHGGKDTGARSEQVNEKELNLIISNHVANSLRTKGYLVVMSRTNDQFVSLPDRAKMANEMDADIFVSIHHNAHSNANANGIENYYYKYYPEYEPEINQEFHNDPVRLARSKLLTELIHKSLIDATNANDRGVKRDTFLVLRESKMAATLLELGFMTNKADLAKITNPDYQKTLSNAIVKGIERFYAAHD